MVTFTLNGQTKTFDGDPDTPLLWVIRDFEKLTGTKYGCGVAQCGACTVHMDGFTRRSCITPISTVDGSEIFTIEGVEGKEADAVKAAWVKIDVPQCGTVNPARSCRPWCCCRTSRSRPTRISTGRWPGISVDAPPTTGSARPFTMPPRRWRVER